MTLIKPSAAVSEMKGKQGGTVFQKSRFGQVMKSLGRPKRKPSLMQQVRRAQNSSVANHWNNTLTQSQRDDWNTYAANTPWRNKFGDSVFLTGQQHHQRNNNFYQLINPGNFLACPSAYGLPDAPVPNLSIVTFEPIANQIILLTNGYITNYDPEAPNNFTLIYSGYAQKGNPEYSRKYVFQTYNNGAKTYPLGINLNIPFILSSWGFLPIKLVRIDEFNRISLPAEYKVTTAT